MLKTEKRKSLLIKCIFSIVVFFGFFIFMLDIVQQYREAKFLKEITVDQLRQFDVPEYMEMMHGVSILTIKQSFYVEDWPDKKDIPYLLKKIESQNYSGTAFSTFSYLANASPGFFGSHIGKFGTTESVVAVHLLKAIKEGGFNTFVVNEYPLDKDEIIAWARAEVEKMEGRD